jgi:hypothetical protein
MARPSPEERAARDQRRAERSKIRAAVQEREADIHLRVKSLANDALAVTDLGRESTPEEIRGMLRRAFMGAMETREYGHAEKCAISLAKFDGLYVERQQLMAGTPQEFQDADEVLSNMRERLGPDVTDRFVAFVDGLRREMRGEDDDNGPLQIEHKDDE